MTILPSSFNLLRKEMSAEDRRRFLFMSVLSVVNGLLDLIGVATLFAVVTALVQPNSIFGLVFSMLASELPESLQIPNLQFLLPPAILTFIFLVKNVFAVWISKVQVKMAFRINQSISDRMIHSHLYADALHHRKEHSAESVNRLSTVSLYLADTLIIASLTLVSEIFVAVLVLLFAAYIWPGMFLYLVASVVPVAVLILAYNRKRLRAFGRENNELIPEIYHTITDSIYGYEEIRLSNTENRFFARLQRLRDQVYKNRRQILLISDHYHFRVLETLVVFSLLIITVLVLWRSGAWELTAVIALYAAIAFRLIPSISRIVGSFNSLSAYTYIAEMMAAHDTPDHSPANGAPSFPEMSGSIRVDHVYFAYREDYPVLREVDFTIRKGDVIGIKGPSGSGKTTLLNLIMGFYFPTSGAVKVDGQLLTENNISGWQKQIAYVRQNAFLLSGTIAENVAFGQVHAETDLHAVHLCLSKVGLWQWVDSLPEKMATKVGELGNAISGGQRQRLAIARAIFKNATVFIFDEPTSSLDNDSLEEVVNTLFDLDTGESTLIIVSHDERIISRTRRQFELIDGNLKEIN